MVKIFLLKSCIFVSLIIGAQAMLIRDSVPQLPLSAAFVNTIVNERPKVIYLADSSILSIRKGETNTDTTAKMLQSMLNDPELESGSCKACEMELYLLMTQRMLREGYLPDVMVIPINMRSFSLNWRHPNYERIRDKRYLSYGGWLLRVMERPLQVFKFFNKTLPRAEYDRMWVYWGDMPVRRIGEAQMFLSSNFVHLHHSQMLLSYIVRYMYDLKANNPKLKAMHKLVDLLQKHDSRVVFYITPINYEQGDRVVGAAFKRQLTKNTALIREILSGKQNVVLLDLSMTLGESYFISDGRYPNEHLIPEGRHWVAEQLYAELKGSY